MATLANVTLKNLNNQYGMVIPPISLPLFRTLLLGRPSGGLYSMRKCVRPVGLSVHVFTATVIEIQPSSLQRSQGTLWRLSIVSELSQRLQRVFNVEGDKFAVPPYGKPCVRMRLVTAKEFNEIDDSLARRFEKETKIHMMTENIDLNKMTNPEFGFEIGGTRFHTRHFVVERGEEIEKLTLVYDYIGPQPTPKT
ncbi:hypothetical protein BGW36DRAFT_355288 [Talaromyces proteolyticus]|uniref:Uncharacterized protein n=1 Tax=Talaromyces proteolyticus TaxID=1131652 RepID=A0AAD4L1G4_9EURO|nr:uncharacterized protein BGW36DRAFT_355288 [Talaromyces proteolyticus]KAH8703891.1 hypothetical protein BGW36DRAFT_355288 [Talaromyces proteolyticus]